MLQITSLLLIYIPKQVVFLNSTIIPSSLFTLYTDYAIDFNYNNKNWLYRGAYSGEGTNPGWHLAIGKKPLQNSATLSSPEIMKSGLPAIQLFPNPASDIAYFKIQ